MISRGQRHAKSLTYIFPILVLLSFHFVSFILCSSSAKLACAKSLRYGEGRAVRENFEDRRTSFFLPLQAKGALSSFTYFEKIYLNYSKLSFQIRFILLHPKPLWFLYFFRNHHFGVFLSQHTIIFRFPSTLTVI